MRGGVSCAHVVGAVVHNTTQHSMNTTTTAIAIKLVLGRTRGMKTPIDRMSTDRWGLEVQVEHDSRPRTVVAESRHSSIPSLLSCCKSFADVRNA